MAVELPKLQGDRYELVGSLGEGGMGHVFRAWDHDRDCWVAVKVLHAHYAKQELARGRFLDEGRTLLGLDHRNVVAPVQVVEADRPYIAMEIAEAGSLKDWVDRHGPMPHRMAAETAIQICKGVGAAHAKGVIHRDIKPHNVLVTRRGICKLTDFGIARLPKPGGTEDVPDATTTTTSGVVGTLGYMAPEQRTHPKLADVRTDVYGIGATLYTLLTGRVVTNLFVAEREPELLTDIPEPLVPLLRKATAYRVEDRYDTVQEFARALFDTLPQLDTDPPGTPSLAADVPPEPPPPEGVVLPPPGPPSLPPMMLAVPTPVPLGSPPTPPSVPSGGKWLPGDTPSPAALRRVEPTHGPDVPGFAPEPRPIGVWLLRGALVLAIVIVVAIGADAMYVAQARSMSRGAGDRFQKLTTSELAVITDLSGLGADRAALEASHAALRAADDDDAWMAAGGAYLAALHEAARVYALPRKGSDATAGSVVARIDRLQAAMSTWQDARAEWRQRATTPPGSVVVSLRLVSAPE